MIENSSRNSVENFFPIPLEIPSFGNSIGNTLSIFVFWKHLLAVPLQVALDNSYNYFSNSFGNPSIHSSEIYLRYSFGFPPNFFENLCGLFFSILQWHLYFWQYTFFRKFLESSFVTSSGSAFSNFFGNFLGICQECSFYISS